jgi:hypothetical protein
MSTMMQPPAIPANPFIHSQYLVRRKVLKLFGGAFHVYDPMGSVVGYSKMKAFKLKEDIRLYTNEQMTQELLVIQARSIIDFGASYDVHDPIQRAKIGALRRKGLKSTFLRDEWLLMDAYDREIGIVREASGFKAFLRRYVDLSLLFPQRYDVTVQNQPVAIFKQNFNPFVYKLNVDLSMDHQGLLDRRLAVASALLMAAVEGKQA